jgi:putative endopeptidase
MRTLLKFALVGTATAAFVAFTPPGNDKTPKYIDRANMDLSVKPGDNFYLYANGNWIKNNPVPGSKTRWGSFDELREESSKRMRTLLEDASKNASKDRLHQMIGDFYSSGMDSLAIERRGYQPIEADLKRIDNVNSVQGVVDEIITSRLNGYGSPLFGVFVSPDRKNVNAYIPQVGQGGTTLPDRDYYIKDDARSKKIRDAYVGHLQSMFQLVGEDASTASANATAVMNIETTLAKAQWSRVEMRDPYKTYNKFSLAELSKTTPNIDWTKVVPAMKINGADSILVTNPAYMALESSMLSSVSLNDWKAYLKWNIIRSAAPSLSSPFVNEDFKFEQVLTGQKEQTPRWQRMSAQIDRTMSDLLGQLYVQKYFPPAAKQRMLDLVNNLQQTFEHRITAASWMSEDTKKKAVEKLHAFTKKIAYPDKWETYDGLVVKKDDYFGNVRRASLWAYNYNVTRMGKPVDKTRWGMTPPTINAQYSPTSNDITFPAGILQYPFFDFGADDAINYGGIGAVIGHEMTHGFDDQGRQYGANGNLQDWWTKEDAQKFTERANMVVNQYNNFTVLDTIHVNGKLTLGENLADLGGLNIAYEAFTHTKQFKEGKKIDGFTPTQRFFLNWAQVWRSNTLPETAAQLILTDPHSPGMHRANGPIVNMDAWYEAFDVKPGDKMYVAPEKRIHIW